MHYFVYKKNKLFCEDVGIEHLAKTYNTPLYVYSLRTLLEHFKKLESALGEVNPLIAYSVKANSNLAILKILVDSGAGLDIVSGGELFRAKKVRCPGSKIVYASVGKTEAEIKEAINYGVLMFNIESLPELVKINDIAGSMNKKAKAAIRINPDVSAKTHKYITTGEKGNKFGIDLETARDIFLTREKYSNVALIGIHMHIGSQITEGGPFVKALKCAVRFIADLKKIGVKLEYLNIGGGLGVIYAEEAPQTALEFAGKVLPDLKKTGLKIILEPGRFIVGNAAALIARVIYVKETKSKTFVVVDAAMNDLIRPALYDAWHTILNVTKNNEASRKPVDIVGPVCESGDFLGKDRALTAQAGDYIAVLGAGAYGFSMSSNYNSRCRACEVLVDKNSVRVIRQRETYDDLIDGEKL